MKLVLPLLAIALVGCAARSDVAATRDQEAFARELAGLAAGEAKTCIPTRDQQSPTIVDERTVTLRTGSTLWVNRLPDACPGLRPLNTLIIEVHGGQYCRGDRVRGLEPGSNIPGPICILGDWVPYRRASGG